MHLVALVLFNNINQTSIKISAFWLADFEYLLAQPENYLAPNIKQFLLNVCMYLKCKCGSNLCI